MELDVTQIAQNVDSRPFEPDFPGKRNPWDKQRHPFNFNYIQKIIDRVDAEATRPPKYDESVRFQVHKLFDLGFTLRQISDATGVSKSTACLWTQEYRRKVATTRVLVTQPGTNNIIETEYTLNEVNLGRITPKRTRGRKRKNIQST